MDSSTLTTPFSIPSFVLLEGKNWGEVRLNADDTITISFFTGAYEFRRSNLPLYVRIAEDESIRGSLRVGTKSLSPEDANAVAQEIADRFNFSTFIIGLSCDRVIYHVTDPKTRAKEERHG